ncbi:MAG TPA: 50S ribosomal protein L23 [Acidimicrobiia bacterium]|nr:50S ribosomal protein L23 [Acidimicrobiia bacterium]
MKDLRDVILAPVVSEKSYDLIEHNNTYTFMVDTRSNKGEIKSAVEQIFGVRVLRVNTMNRKGKLKRQGWKLGRRKDTKRALVTLAAGNSIDVFGV